jgi:hypothetical protein
MVEDEEGTGLRRTSPCQHLIVSAATTHLAGSFLFRLWWKEDEEGNWALHGDSSIEVDAFTVSLPLPLPLSLSWLGMDADLMVVGLPARVRVNPTPLRRPHHHLSLALLHQIRRQRSSDLQVEIFFLHVFCGWLSWCLFSLISCCRGSRSRTIVAFRKYYFVALLGLLGRI